MIRLAAAIVLAATASLGTWLPKSDGGFTAVDKGHGTPGAARAYFVCPGEAVEAVEAQSFDYAGRGCPALARSSAAFSFGSGEPQTGHALYDAAHRVVLFDIGCCAWRSYMLAGDMAKPPAAVAAADLSGVHTDRGVVLGMTRSQVTAIYGPAEAYAQADAPAGTTALTYTTLKGKKWTADQTCLQIQTFSFRSGRLVSIAVLAGC